MRSKLYYLLAICAIVFSVTYIIVRSRPLANYQPSTTYNLNLKSSIISSAFVGTNAWVWSGIDSGLYTSVNGGDTWRKLNVPEFNDTTHISFINSQDGWAVSNKDIRNATVFRTSDGGNTWCAIGELGQITHNYPISAIQQIAFSDQNNGWILEPYVIWQTENGGKTWRPHEKTATIRGNNELYVSLHQVTKSIWLFGGNKQMLYSDDGSTLGQQVNTPIIPHFLSFADENFGWLAGIQFEYNGELYKTNDKGKNWELLLRLDKFTLIRGLYLQNVNEGWLAVTKLVPRDNNPPPIDLDDWQFNNFLMHTTDGGITWQKIEFDSNPTLRVLPYGRLTCSDPSYCWLETNTKFFFTSNGGKTWKNVLIAPLHLPM